MNTATKRIMAIILACLMVLPMVLTACSGGNNTPSTPNEPGDTTESKENESSNNESNKEDSSVNGGESSDKENVNTEPGGNDPEKESTEKDNGEATTEEEIPTFETETLPYPEILDYDGGKIVEYADYIKDGSNAAYIGVNRTHAFIENMNMRMIHGLNGNMVNKGVKNLVNSIENKNGGIYITNTMDAFVRTTDGKTYYASNWITGSSFNVLRGGYYYNEARVQDQGFGDAEKILESAKNIDLSLFKSTSSNQVSDLKVDGNGVLSYVIGKVGGDPGIQTSVDLRDHQISSRTYNALLITMKTEVSSFAEIFVKTHTMSNYDSTNSKFFSMIPGDDYHTYIVRLDDLSGYNGFLTGVRIDIGTADGEKIEIASVKAVNIEKDALPVRLDRGIHAYSDKLHHEIHLVTTAATRTFASYGMITEIAENTVDKLLVKDAKGNHSSLADVDWATVEYIAFDIKGAGIFGYILPNNNSGDTLTVTLENGKYTIVQEHAVAEGVIEIDSNFYMGQRIYTDESHSFAAFEKEAYIERHPLGDKNIIVEYDAMNQAEFIGYDALRGAYKITIKGTSFNAAYKQIWNRHFTANITVKGDKIGRRLYIYAHTKSGNLECAALLNGNQLMLPVPLQVIKNFAGDGEDSIFVKDKSYSETYLPVRTQVDVTQKFTLLNLYQNWGKHPLKQLSWIQFASPYYHISTGVTETNCIMPMYGGGASWKLVHDPSIGDIDEFFVISGKGLSTLPDFRAMSGILWKDQPQHNSCMEIKWLEYWTSEGYHIASDFVDDKIASYGPTYADITLDYVSDDGKIDASYRHMEMPQTDETRTYYTIRLDVNDTIKINSFKNNFNIFETNSRFGPYEKLGYLNAKGEQVVEDADRSGARRFITLGDEAPYFGYFYYYLSPDSNMCNYAVIIKDWDIVLGGEKYDGNFLIEERFENNLNYTRLTLDIGDVTLQKGDYIDINMILLPWGKANDTEDKNVRQVRQDSCINPYKVDATVGTVIEDDFLPMVKAENNTAEFTFSGGHNNGVVRVYGFDKLTSPAVYEFVDGEWVIYELNSITNPDQNQNAHYYDGYCVHYDGENSYSYSFVIPTDQGAERRFKVVAEDFKGYPKDPSPEIADPDVDDGEDAEVDPNEPRPEGEGAPKYYYSAQDLFLMAEDDSNDMHMLDTHSLKIENGMKYARYLTMGMENQDAYIVLHKNMTNALQVAPFVAIKYRSKTPNASMEFWVNSYNLGYEPGKGNAHIGIVDDGEWHYAILDLTVSAGEVFDGKTLYLLRFDFLNSSTPALPAKSYIDIAYIGFFKTEEEAGRFEFGDEFKTQEEVKNENNSQCVDPSSEYTLSDKVYGTNIDYINGENVTWSAGNSKYGVSVIDYNKNTLTDARISIAGWSVVDGGIAKYIWSADGGKTWYKTDGDVGHGAQKAHYNVICGKIGTHTFSEGSNLNSTYQTAPGVIGGRIINLTPYTGKTVDVIFAAVPAKDTKTICPLILFKNVTVVGSSEEPEKDSDTPAVEEDTRTPEQIKADNNALCIGANSQYKESDIAYGSNLDAINAIATSQVNLYEMGGNSKYGVAVFKGFNTTLDDGHLLFSGWVVVDGGINKYVYSTDGGNTWKDAKLYNMPSIASAGTAHFNWAANNQLGGYSFSENSGVNGKFQPAAGAVAGIAADLNGKGGETVDVIFAAVPENDKSSVCLIALVKDVTVIGEPASEGGSGEETTTNPGGGEETEDPIEKTKNENNALCIDPSSGYTLSDAVYGTSIDAVNGKPITYVGGNSKYGVAVIEYNGNTLDDGRIVIGGWTVVDGGVYKYIWSADGGKTWYKVGFHTIAGVSSGAVNAHYNVVRNGIGDREYVFSDNSPKNSTYQVAANTVGGIALNLAAFKDKTVDVVFAAVPVNDSTTICPLVLLKGVKVTGGTTAAEEDVLEEYVKTDAEIKVENNSGLVAADSAYTVSDVVYGANLDFINAKTLSNNGGNSRYGCSHYTDEITTFSNGRVVFTGWTVVDGGVKDYVYSLDGGKTWIVIPGDPGNGASQAHYNVITSRIGAHTFSEGSNIKSTFAGSQSQGESISGLGINLTAYAGQTISLTFAAIPVNDPDGLCLIAHLENVNVVVK